jgi:hypothetical protein
MSASDGPHFHGSTPSSTPRISANARCSGAARELRNHRAELLFELMDVDFDQHGLGILQRLRSGVADLVEPGKAGFFRDEVPRVPNIMNHVCGSLC